MAVHLGKYEVLGRFARGGTADLLLARDKRRDGFEKRLALKVLHAAFSDDAGVREAFEQEARIGASYTHPNIVHIWDFIRAQGRHAIVMEYVDGMDLESLAQKMRERHEPLPLAVVIGILRKVLEALHHAHELRDASGVPLALVHRDLTPSNILLSRDGIVKVADFGMAKVATSASRTRTGVLKGKLAYMPPEQAYGRVVDRRADIFAVGVIAWELLRARRARDADTELEVLRLAQRGEIGAIDDVTEPMRGIIARATAPSPEARFETALTFLEALREQPAVESEAIATLVREHAREVELHEIEEEDVAAMTRVVRAPKSPPLPRLRVMAGGVVFVVLLLGSSLLRPVFFAARRAAVSQEEVVAAPLPETEPVLPVPRDVIPSPHKGQLTVNSRPWAAVSIDGTRVAKTTPLWNHRLDAGRHSVTLERPGGQKTTFEVEIFAGQTLTRTYDWRP
jgi:eukaryotic-like serine/threonine-protein kinase